MIGIGSVINGKYRLTRLLGDGGMGSVYEAQHVVLGTRVAIKVLHPELVRRSGLVERFLQEARVAAQIRSPHVVQVVDVDRTPDGHAYIVMELLEGEPLGNVLDRQRKLAVPTACEYARQILVALEAAHALGVIHRDLKPENVFVTFVGGRAVLKLIDFGIAKARRDAQQKNLTVAGVVMGTAEYMAPEQARSADKVDARADIYAAGVMLYEMLAGSRPVPGDDARVIALRVERGDIVPLVQAAPEVPRELAGLVHRAMAARPELRFPTATEMRLALEGATSAKRPSTAAMPAPTSNVPVPSATVAGEPSPMTRAGRPTPEPAPPAPVREEPPVRTMRAPPIASALNPAYAGAAVPAVPVHQGTRTRRRRGNTVALVALPILLGAGIVGVLIGTGTWAQAPSAGPPTPGAPAWGDEATPDPTPSVTTPPKALNDVPTLVPTRPLPPSPAPAPRPSPSTRPTPGATADAAAPGPLPFLLPTALPSTLPPFPSVLPPFPSNLPSVIPSVLPAWPAIPLPSPSGAPAPSHAASSSGGPGY